MGHHHPPMDHRAWSRRRALVMTLASEFLATFQRRDTATARERIHAMAQQVARIAATKPDPEAWLVASPLFPVVARFYPELLPQSPPPAPAPAPAPAADPSIARDHAALPGRATHAAPDPVPAAPAWPRVRPERNPYRADVRPRGVLARELAMARERERQRLDYPTQTRNARVGYCPNYIKNMALSRK